MGNVYAELTLKNAGDVIFFKRGLTQEPEIRQMTVTAMVDTGAWTLVINEAVRDKLGLEEGEDDWVTLANGVIETVKKASPIEVHWKNRSMICRPIVLSGNEEVLLGAIPMEDMDLIVDPRGETVIGKHGDRIIKRL